MTDLNPDVTDDPIVVSPSAAGIQASTGSRDLLLLLAALPALVAALGTRDVVKIVAWIGSEPGLAFVGLVIALATPVYRQWLARRKHAETVTITRSAPDSVAVIKGEEPQLETKP
jgi:Flp pilus assembly protein TadB